MKFVPPLRAVLTASLAGAVLAGMFQAPTVAADLPLRTALSREAGTGGVTIPVPPVVTEPWDGKAGVADQGDPRMRQLVADIAAFEEEPPIRAAAIAALQGDGAAIVRFLDVDLPRLHREAAERRRVLARKNVETIRGMAGTGVPGGHFRREAARVLAGNDTDRQDFLDYGADVARSRDEADAKRESERKQVLRQRLEVLATTMPVGSNLRRAAEAAVAGGDTAIAAFWKDGYLTASRADAAEREQHRKDLEARNKAVEDLSDLARRSRLASEARTRLMKAHGDAVDELQRSANAMATAANAARSAARTYAAKGTAASKQRELDLKKQQTANAARAAREALARARTAATIATSASDDLVKTGLPYGAEWSVIVQAMSAADEAALGATVTADQAVAATVAANKARTAQARAKANQVRAVKWREHAQKHAVAAAKLADAAKRQADAAKTAAVRARVAREQAQAAERQAWEGAARTRAHRQTAESEAAKAAKARAVAERERTAAAAHRARAEQQAATARAARGQAAVQARAAETAREAAGNADLAAGKAGDRAWAEERKASKARHEAVEGERAEQTAKAKEAAWRAAAASKASGAEKDEALRQAGEAGKQSVAAGLAARGARGAAATATGAAASARSSATQAEAAAERAWAAAQDARAAAAAADAAADRAEAAAAETHAARLRADARAAEATAEQARAAEAARTATDLAARSADEALKALWAANRTKFEAHEASREAVAAAVEADNAVRAASAARDSAAGIARPHDTAIAMVSPFTGADIDADFIKQVVDQAATIGAQQAAAARKRADEAVAAAVRAEAAARSAAAQVKPAYDAAARAARSAANAAQSAAEAKQAAAHAAAEAALARAAAAGAANADAQAKADAGAARNAANTAAQDAAIAGRNAAAARADAAAAAGAATRAEADAAAAQTTATRAEADANTARESAVSAGKAAESAATAATNALALATEAQKAADRAEEADREKRDRAIARAASGEGLPTPEEQARYMKNLTPEQQQRFRQAMADAGRDVFDFIRENAPGLLEELTGIGDLRKCFLEGNVEACMWSIVGMVPWAKAFKVVKKLAGLIPGLIRFLETAKRGRADVEELRKVAERTEQVAACAIGKRNSFLPHTRVLLADGRTRRIDEVRIGDLVQARDMRTGLTVAKPVTKTLVGRGRKVLVNVTADENGPHRGGVATLTATANHPFWVEQARAWIEAGSLRPSQRLLSASGTTLPIAATRAEVRFARVHNLTVAEAHTYHVLLGSTPVLVHNVNGCGDLDALSAAGRGPGKGPRNAAGFSYQKHMDRGELPQLPSKHPKAQNEAGEALLDEILTNPMSQYKNLPSGRVRVVGPDGTGLTFRADGTFAYFGKHPVP